MRSIIYIALCFSFLFISCDKNRVFESNITIKKNKWSLDDRPVFYVDIQDTVSAHNVYFNVRNTGNFKYSNLFILLTVEVPQSKPETNRYEFRLADPDGKWLGSGLGDIYSNRIKLEEKIKFPKKGVYKFTIEQNMRDNPLEGIEDVGLRIEKAVN
jgi:gliding motility-associated lipoprotein GldH